MVCRKIKLVRPTTEDLVIPHFFDFCLIGIWANGNLLANGQTQKFIAKRYSITEANLSRWLNKHRI
jgi:hypothetical protein